MKDSVIEFIKKQKCASICGVDESGMPYCFSCFYAYNSESNLLYFKSSANTYHMKLMLQNTAVAGTILPDKLQLLAVKGIQFSGELLSKEHPLAKDASHYYHAKHPLALTVPGEVWSVQLNFVKMTDSTHSFGEKLIWMREAVVA